MNLTETKLPVSLRLRAARVAAGAMVLVASTGVAATLHFKASTPIVYAMQTAQNAAIPAPAPESSPAAQAPAPAPAPAPKAARRPGRGADQTSEDQEVRKLTPQESKELDEQTAHIRDEMQKLKLQLKIDPIVVPKFDFKIFDSPEFVKSMADIKVQVDTPEFRKQMAEMKARMDSPEFKKQMEEVAKSANYAVTNSAEFKRKMEEINRQVNSPEFKQQIETAKRMAMEAQADAGRRNAEMRKQLAEASAAIAEAKKQVQDEKVQKQLDEAQRRIENAIKP